MPDEKQFYKNINELELSEQDFNIIIRGLDSIKSLRMSEILEDAITVTKSKIIQLKRHLLINELLER